MILGVASIALLSLTANAQENGNRDANGNIVKGAYETNAGKDNWFINAGVGAQGFFGPGYETKAGLATDLYVGKWFTPSVGARAGWKGMTAAVGAESGYKIPQEKYWLNGLKGDLLWNFSNAVSGYKETRTWDFIPYVSAGWYDANGRETYVESNREFGMGVGLINNIRLGNRVDLNIDLSAIHTRNQLMNIDKYYRKVGLIGSITAGLQINLGKTGFDRHSSITPVVVPMPFTVDQYNALKDKVAALEAENAALKNRISELENRKPETVYVETITPAGATVYFDCGKSTLSQRELAHLEYYASALDKDAKLTLTGSADKQTGNASINQKLSEKRANYVADILTNKYGLDKDNLTIVAEGDKNNVYDTPAKNRCVTITK